MKSWNLGRYALYALSISSVAALLAGCRANPGIGIPTNSGSTTRMHSAANGKTFSYTGKPQVFKVPAGVYSITVVMRGASSAWQACQYSGGGYGGRGARVSAVIPVTPHQKLWVYVGGAGNGSSGGFNGGGNGGEVDRTTGGAGASDVRVAPGRRVDRILVAGGGGGEGPPSGNTSFSDWGCPGYGGGLVGGDGLDGLDYYGGGGGGGGGGSQHRVPRTTVTLAKTGGLASAGPAAKSAPMPSAAAVVAAADITAAVAGEAVRTVPLITAAVAEEEAVLHLPSPKPRKFIFGRIGKTPPATVL